MNINDNYSFFFNTFTSKDLPKLKDNIEDIYDLVHSNRVKKAIVKKYENDIHK